MKISVDANKCIGCGLCESLSEGAIVLNSDTYKAEPKEGFDLSSQPSQAAVKTAEESCPVQAIKVEE